MIVPAAPAEAMAAPSLAQAAAPANPGITNNQSAGVDEGGIVKQIGRYLVVLQDGRLFSIDLGDGDRGGMRLADRADVYRSAETAASWYDEMLVFGDRILVTAYNYRESASEITVLRLDSAGRIRREARYLMSSNDYYSTENYASRLVGDNLVFYAPHPLLWGGEDERFAWPTLRRADADGEAGKGEALIGPTDVTMPAGKVDYPVIHTVAVCPLRERIACRTTAFVGPEMRELYVSPSDAYLWIGAPAGLPWSIDYGNRRRNPGCAEGRHWNDPGEAAAMLYRLPLDGAPVGAVAVEGVPDDQFAFEAKDGHFRALLTRPRAGCAAPDAASPLALMDLPLSVFGPRVRRVAESAYAPLPAIAGGQIEKRFVGDWLVYGGRDGWSSMPAEGAAAQGSTLFAVPLAQPAKVARLALPHNAIRIERVGSDALVTGYRGAEGLSLSYVRLGAAPAIASTALLPDRFESENRSHAFNAAVQADGSGVMGIPTTLRIRRAGRGWSDSASSDLSFLAFGLDRKLAPAGELGLEGGKPAPGYACQVSCVDWYGNSRPIFTGGRIFALMGTELVEGTMREGRIVERGRVDLTRPVS
ncbi:MAG: beta-propeller domain-containing protein [Sphingomonas sp.]